MEILIRPLYSVRKSLHILTRSVNFERRSLLEAGNPDPTPYKTKTFYFIDCLDLVGFLRPGISWGSPSSHGINAY